MQLHFTLAGAFRGAGDTGKIWRTLILDHIARIAWLLWSFVRGRWRRRL